jgi:hypothetical protein
MLQSYTLTCSTDKLPNHDMKRDLSSNCSVCSKLKLYTFHYGSHYPHVATEHLKCCYNKVTCVTGIKYMLDFEGLVQKM